MTVSAKVILDSISHEGVRLTTMELRYPRFIHSEFMTHRVFSRNASSSRAVPVEKLIEEAENSPAMPERWGIHNTGMQDGGTMTPFGEKTARDDWLAARDAAVARVKTMISRQERCSKQIINRILEPFTHITVLVSSTFWANFDVLRADSAADPTMQALANAVISARNLSEPTQRVMGDWHLPFIVRENDEDIHAAMSYALDTISPQDATLENLDRYVINVLCRVSAARCARVSYLTHDQRKPTIEEDLDLFGRLMTQRPLHASPAEHQATPDSLRLISDSAFGWADRAQHGNFVGWKQFRKQFVGEAVMEYQDMLVVRTRKQVA